MKTATKTQGEWKAIWQHFNRMQKRVMTPESIVSKQEFFAESESERLDYYEWMQRQCGEFSCWM